MEEKTLTCEIYLSRFTQKNSLKKHIESIHRGKIFKCEFCPSSYTQKDNLKRHIKSVHRGKTFRCHGHGQGFFKKKMALLYL